MMKTMARMTSSSGRPNEPIAALLGTVILSSFASGSAVVGGQFSSGVNLVEVYATVTDERGEPIGDLSAADFRVAEDGIPQMVSAFAAGEFPLSVAIGVDRSFSMASGKVDRLSAVKNAARTFVGALRAGDQVMVIAVGSETEVAAPLSADRAAALAAIDRIEPWGTTPLYDATVRAIDAIQSAKGRRALVLLSDGVDRYSDTQPAALLDRARRSDVLAYPIAIGRTRARRRTGLAVDRCHRQPAWRARQGARRVFLALNAFQRHGRIDREADLERLEQAPFQRAVLLATGDEIGHHCAYAGALPQGAQ